MRTSFARSPADDQPSLNQAAWTGHGQPTPPLRLPRHRATTRHLAAVYPFHADPGLPVGGVYLGENALGGGSAFCYDPFALYTAGAITSPNIVVLGMVGSGKSSFVKTFLYRSLGVFGSRDHRPRWAAIIDPKGEYGPLADALGMQIIRLEPGGTTRLNPLDTHTSAATRDELALRRTAMTAALIAQVLGRDLTPVEDATLGWAIDDLTNTHTDQPPTLGDVAAILANPTGRMVERSGLSIQELASEIAACRHTVDKLCHRELRGMFDGPSTVDLTASPRGVVIDVSAVHANPDTFALVMIATTGWLQSLFTAQRGPDAPLRVQVLEEIWALLGNERVARYYQASQKLSRDYGVANIAVAHRIADLRAQTDDGSAAAKVSMGLLADTQTRILFRQPPDQIPEARATLGLTSVEAELLPQLQRGRALWKIAGHTAVVQGRIHPDEHPICDTNGALAVSTGPKGDRTLRGL